MEHYFGDQRKSLIFAFSNLETHKKPFLNSTTSKLVENTKAFE